MVCSVMGVSFSIAVFSDTRFTISSTSSSKMML
jgi:hypothetical protein